MLMYTIKKKVITHDLYKKHTQYCMVGYCSL